MTEGIGMGWESGSRLSDQEKLLQGWVLGDKEAPAMWRLRGAHHRQGEQQEQGPGVNPVSTLHCFTTGSGCQATFLCAAALTVPFSRCPSTWPTVTINCHQNFSTLKVSCSAMSDSLQPHGLHSPWNSPDQNTGVGRFPFSMGSSQPRDPTQVSHIPSGLFTSWATKEAQENEWVAYPFARGSFWPRNQTRVSCIAGRFFTSWATGEAHALSAVNLSDKQDKPILAFTELTRHPPK